MRFEWGTTTAYGKVLQAGTLPVDSATRIVARRLTGLTPGTTYHARLVSTGPGGTVAGADTTFRTPKRQTALRLRSSLISTGGSTSVGVPVVCPPTTVTCKGKVVLRRVNKKRTSLGSKSVQHRRGHHGHGARHALGR